MTEPEEQKAFEDMPLNELVAYYNILVMGTKCVQVTDDPERLPRHRQMVTQELTKRGCTIEPGKLLKDIRS